MRKNIFSIGYGYHFSELCSNQYYRTSSLFTDTILKCKRFLKPNLYKELLLVDAPPSMPAHQHQQADRAAHKNLQNNPSLFLPKHPDTTFHIPATYLRAINCIISALNNAQVIHRDGRRQEAFGLQVYRKR